MKIEVIDEKCVGCGLCKTVCLYNSIRIEEGKARITESCTYCGACVEACRHFGAITLEKQEQGKKTEEEYSGIIIYAEHKDGKLNPVVPELIGIAKKLAEELKDKTISAILVGNEVENLDQELIAYGADQVLLADKPEVSFYNEDSQACLIEGIINRTKPEIFLGGATNAGRSIFPRVAAKLSTGLTADCTALEIDKTSGLLRQTRPAFGGNVMATIITRNHLPQMATVRPNLFPPVIKSEGRHGVVIDFSNICIPESQIQLLDYRKNEKKSVLLDEADVILAVGRGAKNEELLPLIRELADKLKGTLGASRAAVDEGWIPYSLQIGQTGKTVKPSIYFALGISGAVQHIVGMERSDVIIAVNTDPDADIFKVADYGIIGDLNEIIPKMLQQLNERVS